MIKDHLEFRTLNAQLLERIEKLKARVRRMSRQGCSKEEISLAISDVEMRLNGMQQDIILWEQLSNRDPQALLHLETGQLLIGLRIYRGITQIQLAEGLGIELDEVKRGEMQEYKRISLSKYLAILAVMGIKPEPERPLRTTEEASTFAKEFLLHSCRR